MELESFGVAPGGMSQHFRGNTSPRLEQPLGIGVRLRDATMLAW